MANFLSKKVFKTLAKISARKTIGSINKKSLNPIKTDKTNYIVPNMLKVLASRGTWKKNEIFGREKNVLTQ